MQPNTYLMLSYPKRQHDTKFAGKLDKGDFYFVNF